jgi:hypothetical protein
LNTTSRPNLVISHIREIESAAPMIFLLLFKAMAVQNLFDSTMFDRLSLPSRSSCIRANARHLLLLRLMFQPVVYQFIARLGALDRLCAYQIIFSNPGFLLPVITRSGAHERVRELSNEWQTKADEVLHSTMAELARPPQPRRVPPPAPPPSDENVKPRRRHAVAEIAEIEALGRSELDRLASIPAQQQQLFPAQKNDIWERLVRERREEAAGLAAIATRLSAEVAGARSRAKSDTDDAKRRAAESTRAIRVRRKQQLRLLEELTKNVETDRQQFEAELARVAAANAEAMRQKEEQIVRLQSNLETAKVKLREKQEAGAAKFKEKVHVIRELRKELSQVRELEAEKQAGLLALRQQAAVIAKRILAKKDETAAFGRQLATLIRDNEEGQREITKLEAGMFPGAFPVVRL